ILPINCKGIRRSSKIICYIARIWARRRMRPLKILLYYAKIHIHEATKGNLHFPDGGYLFFISCELEHIFCYIFPVRQALNHTVVGPCLLAFTCTRVQKICLTISPAHRRTARTSYFLPQPIHPTPFCQWMAGKEEQAVPA